MPKSYLVYLKRIPRKPTPRQYLILDYLSRRGWSMLPTHEYPYARGATIASLLRRGWIKSRRRGTSGPWNRYTDLEVRITESGIITWRFYQMEGYRITLLARPKPHPNR